MTEIKNGAILSYFNILIKNIVNILYIPFLLRFVGQSEYGLFQMTNSTVMSLSLLSMGFSSAYVKYYINYKVKEDNRSISKLNGFYLLLFSLISILSLILGFFLVKNSDLFFGSTLNESELNLTKYLMFFLVINVAITFPSSVFDANILANEKFVFQQVRQILQSLLPPLIAVPLIISGSGVLSIVISQTIVTLIFLILNIHFCIVKLNMKFIFKPLPRVILIDLCTFSFFVFLNQVVDIVNNNVPNFILGMFVGAKGVATFSIATQLKNIFFMLSVSLSNVFIPKINKMVSSGESNDALIRIMIKIGRIQMSILLFFLGGYIILGKFFMLKWAGDTTGLSYILTISMVIPAIPPLTQNIGIEIQRAYNKHFFRSVSFTICALLNTFITVYCTKTFGVIGSPIGYIFSLVVANGFLMNWYYKNRMQLDIVKYWKNVLSCVIPGLVLVPCLLFLTNILPVNNLITFFLWGVLYSILYLIIFIKFVSTDYEKQFVSSVLSVRRER